MGERSTCFTLMMYACPNEFWEDGMYRVAVFRNVQFRNCLMHVHVAIAASVALSTPASFCFRCEHCENCIMEESIGARVCAS